jgi:hypothetical protein
MQPLWKRWPQASMATGTAAGRMKGCRQMQQSPWLRPFQRARSAQVPSCGRQRPTTRTARAGTRRVGRLSNLRSHAKAICDLFKSLFQKQ